MARAASRKPWGVRPSATAISNGCADFVPGSRTLRGLWQARFSRKVPDALTSNKPGLCQCPAEPPRGLSVSSRARTGSGTAPCLSERSSNSVSPYFSPADCLYWSRTRIQSPPAHKVGGQLAGRKLGALKLRGSFLVFLKGLLLHQVERLLVGHAERLQADVEDGIGEHAQFLLLKRQAQLRRLSRKPSSSMHLGGVLRPAFDIGAVAEDGPAEGAAFWAGRRWRIPTAHSGRASPRGW